MNLYRFIDAQKAVYGTRRLCRVMAVPESSYFDWNIRGRGVAAAKADREQVLVEQIQVFHDASTATYGRRGSTPISSKAASWCRDVVSRR